MSFIARYVYTYEEFVFVTEVPGGVNGCMESCSERVWDVCSNLQ